jgi:hypothetical protein
MVNEDKESIQGYKAVPTPNPQAPCKGCDLHGDEPLYFDEDHEEVFSAETQALHALCLAVKCIAPFRSDKRNVIFVRLTESD